MSTVKSRMGRWNLTWKSVPRGPEGVAHVQVEGGETIEVRWTRDQDGIWILLPNKGTFGFDLQGEWNDEGQMVYHVSQRGSHLEWAGICPSQGDVDTQSVSKSKGAKAVRVRAQMPGKILRVMTAVGQTVEKNQPIVVMEAMKMENEIRAPQAGKVSQVKITEGQAVETGADLVLIDGTE